MDGPPRGATDDAPQQQAELSQRAVRVQGVLIGVVLLWLVAVSWHVTRHQVDKACENVDGHRVCVERIQTWWNPFGPREDDIRVTVDVHGCGTRYPSPLPVDRPLHPQFRGSSVVLRAADGARFVDSTRGDC